MSPVAGIAIMSLVEAIEKIGKTFLDGDSKDNLTDVLDALLGLFGLGSDEKKCDAEEEKEG